MALINCPECGKEVSDRAAACIWCGAPLDDASLAANRTSGIRLGQFNNVWSVQNQNYGSGTAYPNGSVYNNSNYNPNVYPSGYLMQPNRIDVPSAGLNIISFLFPFIGLIVYLAIKDESPNKASSAGKAAWIGFILWLVCVLVLGAQ